MIDYVTPLRFNDGHQFLSCSLAQAVGNLKMGGIDKLTHLIYESLDLQDTELLTQKGVYSYDSSCLYDT